MLMGLAGKHLRRNRGRRGTCQVVGQYGNQRFAAPGPGGLVFIGPKGGRLRRSNFRKFWHRARNGHASSATWREIV